MWSFYISGSPKASPDNIFNYNYYVLSKVENEKIISQFVGTSEVCDQNGDRVSKTD